ncbi:MAG TPA: hypothetical protein VGG56_04395 [Terracidiphilus sp.]|jgi:hypothetical protein
MIKEISFCDVPNLSIVKERVLAICPNVEYLKAELDEAPVHYLLKLQLAKRTTLRLSKELVDDLSGKNTAHRDAELDQLIRSAIGRMK